MRASPYGCHFGVQNWEIYQCTTRYKKKVEVVSRRLAVFILLFFSCVNKRVSTAPPQGLSFNRER